MTAVAAQPNIRSDRVAVKLTHDLMTRDHDHHRNHQRDGCQPVENSAPEQGAHRVDRRPVDQDSNEARNDDDRIESCRLLRLIFEAFLPAEDLRDRESRRAGKDRHRKEARADDADCEEDEGELPSNRTKRLRGVGRRADLGDRPAGSVWRPPP